MKFIKIRKIAYLISLSLIAVGLFSILYQKGFNYGIDFTGGVLLQVQFKQKVTTSEIRDLLSDASLGNIVIQSIGLAEENQFIIKSKYVENPEEQILLIQDKIKKHFGEDKLILPFPRSEVVGPAIGKDLRNLAFLLLFVALAGILLYISIRFRFNFAVASIVALVHDVLITMGVLSLLHKEINIPIIAALLTIIGYSLNDTIVVFDRIRENMKSMHGVGLEEIMDSSLKTTLSRTVITSLTTLLAVLALYLFGGPVINDFSFTMLVGIIIGTYSSIFVASPVLYEWETHIAAKRKRK
ncbi:MAG: protein translocase subunit SecF [Spirochaetes bacterium]|nr:protein translocase subunit SecF [Spirochaetota bacterium]